MTMPDRIEGRDTFSSGRVTDGEPSAASRSPGGTMPRSPALGPPGQPQDGSPPPRQGGGPLVAPLVALFGLMLVAGGSVFAASKLDLIDGAAATPTPVTAEVTSETGRTYDPNATDTPAPAPTPTPQPIPVMTPPPNEVATVQGTLLYVRDGDIYSFSGTTSTRMSDQGTNSSPTWSEDGSTIYFVRTKEQRGGRRRSART